MFRASQGISWSAQCAFKIWRVLLYLHHEGRLCCFRCLYDKIKAAHAIFCMRIEPLLRHFECAKSYTWCFLDVARATKRCTKLGISQYDSPLLELTKRKECLCCSWSIWMCIERPLSVFKIKIIIWMSLELKHKNFKDENKIKERVKFFYLYIRSHMFMLVATQSL